MPRTTGQPLIPGQQWVQTLAPNPAAARGYRVVAGSVWWRLVFWPWRNYLASRAAFIPARPPDLAPLGAPGVFFTDQQSLQGILSPGDFATRVGLSQQAQVECQRYGCAVVEFDIGNPGACVYPTPYPGTQQGITVGGAREWITQGNISLARTMLVYYIDVTSSGPGHFEIPL